MERQAISFKLSSYAICHIFRAFWLIPIYALIIFFKQQFSLAELTLLCGAIFIGVYGIGRILTRNSRLLLTSELISVNNMPMDRQNWQAKWTDLRDCLLVSDSGNSYYFRLSAPGKKFSTIYLSHWLPENQTNEEPQISSKHPFHFKRKAADYPLYNAFKSLNIQFREGTSASFSLGKDSQKFLTIVIIATFIILLCAKFDPNRTLDAGYINLMGILVSVSIGVYLFRTMEATTATNAKIFLSAMSVICIFLAVKSTSLIIINQTAQPEIHKFSLTKTYVDHQEWRDSQLPIGMNIYANRKLYKYPKPNSTINVKILNGYLGVYSIPYSETNGLVK